MCDKSREEVGAIVREVFSDENPERFNDNFRWHQVFVKVFGSPPVGPGDHRWNELLNMHELNALHEALECFN